MRLPLPAIIALFALSILADLYIWKDIRQGKSKNRWGWSNAYAISSFLLWIFLAVIVAMPRRSLDGGVYAVMWMLTVYLSIYVPKHSTVSSRYWDAYHAYSGQSDGNGSTT